MRKTLLFLHHSWNNCALSWLMLVSGPLRYRSPLTYEHTRNWAQCRRYRYIKIRRCKTHPLLRKPPTLPCDFTNNLDCVNAHLNFRLIICNSHMYNCCARGGASIDLPRDFIVLIDERNYIYRNYAARPMLFYIYYYNSSGIYLIIRETHSFVKLHVHSHHSRYFLVRTFRLFFLSSTSLAPFIYSSGIPVEL